MQNVLDSRQLLAFSTLARVGSFTQAAKELGLTQSAISHAMKALESDVGCRLCDRAGRKVMLTQAGEQFLQHCERILAEMDQARTGLNALNNWGNTRLRIGASTSACQYILPTVLREFKQRYPRCSISIEPGDHDRQLELLEKNQIDLAFMLEPTVRNEFVFVPLFEDELMFLVSPTHAWAVQGHVPHEAISKETIILYTKTSHTFKLISGYFHQTGITLTRYIELGSMEAIKELVKLGMGAGIMAPWIAQNELAQGTMVAFPLPSGPLRRRWGVAYPTHRRLSLSEETFVTLCRSQTENMGLHIAAPAA